MLRKGLQPQVVQKHPIPRQNEIETLILQLTRVEHSAAAKPFPQDADLAAGNRYDHVRVEHHCHKCRDHEVDHYTREMALKEPPPPRWCPRRGHRPIYWPQIHFHDLILPPSVLHPLSHAANRTVSIGSLRAARQFVNTTMAVR